jgi:hypothetical protein
MKGCAANKPFAVIGAGSWSNQQQLIIVLLSGLDGILLSFLLLTCTFISLLSFSSGLDKQ